MRTLRIAHTLALTLMAALWWSRAWALDDGYDWYDPEPEPDMPQTSPGTSCFDECTTCSRPDAWVDDDDDGIPDRLENDIAHKFFPNVLLQHADVDRDESYLYNGSASPYAILPVYGGLCDTYMECFEIRYGIAFFYDHGDNGLYDHVGDSELYAAVVRRTASWSTARGSSYYWRLIRDFTSAHWGVRFSDSSQLGAYGFCPECVDRGHCGGAQQYCYGFSDEATCERYSACDWRPYCTYEGDAICYSDTPRWSYVSIYAAESKHALYHTDRECDNGGFSFFGADSDECPRRYYHGYTMRSWKSGKLQNVGNSNNHARFDTTIQDPDGCGSYDVWSGRDFGGAGDYLHHFTVPINWAL